ncbi:MAG: hypothetical protein QXI09_03475 [Candidatus Aenigmatarchaeota archaeon]
MKNMIENNGLKCSLTTYYNIFSKNVLIDDLYLTLKLRKLYDIAHLDTSLELDKKFSPMLSNIYVCSENDKLKCEKIGLKVKGVVPRPINPAFFHYDFLDPKKKIYDCIVIGAYRIPDRKNIYYACKIIEGLKLKSVGITNYNFNFTVKHKFGSVNDRFKAYLIRNSKILLFLSGCEGFGLPPMEASALYTIPILLDIPPLNQCHHGVFVKPLNHKIMEFNLAYLKVKEKIYFPNIKDCKEKVSEILNMGKEEYYNLAIKCREKALENQRQFNYFLNKTILSI